jgi:hypothetical protein
MNDGPIACVNPEWRAFTDSPSGKGKISRFRGMSGHGSSLVKSLDYAIDNDLVDVILAAHSFGRSPASTTSCGTLSIGPRVRTDLPAYWPRRSRRICVIAMKTLMGAASTICPLRASGRQLLRKRRFAGFSSNPNVDALIVSMTSTELIDEY